MNTNASAGESFSAPASQPPVMFWRVFDTLFLFLIFYIPFSIALNISQDVDLASIRVLIIIFFLAWLAGVAFLPPPLARDGGLRGRIFLSSFQGFGLPVILLISGVSLFFAQEPSWGWRKLAVFLSILPLYYMTASLTSRHGREKILKVLAGSAIAAAFVGLVQFLLQFFSGVDDLTNFYAQKLGPFFWGQSFSEIVQQNQSWLVDAAGHTLMRAIGLFPDPHMLAFFLGLILPIVFSLWLFREKNRTGWFFAAGFLFIVLLLTFSRGGYLGAIFSIAAVLFFAWKNLGQNKRFLVMAGLALLLVASIVLARPIANRFVSSFTLSEGSSTSRLQIWASSWQVFLDHPLFGVGLGNYPRAIDPLVPYRNPITSHNLYLDILSETGVFGLAAWLLLIFGSLYKILKSIRKDSHDPARAINPRTKDIGVGVKIGLFGSLVYFVVHSFFETAIFNPAVLAVFMIVLGLAAASNITQHNEELA